MIVGRDRLWAPIINRVRKRRRYRLDLLKLFRVLLVDLPVIASINRRQWDAEEDFAIAGEQVWLSDEGRRKFIRNY